MMTLFHGICRNKILVVFLLITAICFVTSFSVIHFTPPGTVKLKKNNGIFVDKREVLNGDWADYLMYQEIKYGKNSNEYKDALPDSIIWHSTYPSGKINRFDISSATFPIIGITYEQAVNYCNWRSDRVNEKYGKSVTYRLPTRDEWENISKTILNKKRISFQKGLISVKNKTNNIISMQDNVSEMIAEKGIAKGMNWVYLDTTTQKITYSDISVEFTYESPTNYIGFRCVAMIN